MFRRALSGVVIMFTTTTAAFAAHPLITDDTGTQGKGKFQVEVNSEFGYDKETADGVVTKEKAGKAATFISAGIADNSDAETDITFLAGLAWRF